MSICRQIMLAEGIELQESFSIFQRCSKAALLARLGAARECN